MKTIKILFIIFLTTILSINIYAQNPRIDSLKILPENPTALDTVKLIAYGFAYYTPCGIDSSVINSNGYQIVISAVPIIGIGAALCSSIDTMEIGLLKEGAYELICNLENGQPLVVYDRDTIHFNIQPATAIDDNKQELRPEIAVFPNPATNILSIELNNFSSGNMLIDFYSVYGQKVKTIQTAKDKTDIDIRDLNNGIYLLIFSNEREKQLIKKVIINHL